MNIFPGCADRLKAELQLREPSVWVGVPPSGGIRTGSTDRLKAELQLPESLGFRGIPGFGRCSPQWSGDPRRTEVVTTVVFTEECQKKRCRRTLRNADTTHVGGKPIRSRRTESRPRISGRVQGRTGGSWAKGQGRPYRT